MDEILSATVDSRNGIVLDPRTVVVKHFCNTYG